MRHNLKILPEFFDQTLAGKKPWDIRYNDRDYKVGDILNLREWTPQGGYTGREILTEVTYIFSEFGLKPGWIIMSFGINPYRGLNEI